MGANIVCRNIHVFALPMNSTYILVTQKLRSDIEKSIISNGGIDSVSRQLGVSQGYFYRFLKGKRCSLYFLFKIYNNLDISLESIERNVLEITSGKNNIIGIKRPRLPFILNNEFGGTLLGGIMGDGSVTRQGGITYNNKNLGLVNGIVQSAKTIFGDVDYRISKKKDGTLQLDLPKITGDIVMLTGIKRSYKTISDCYIELSKYSKKFYTHFIRQFFDDEGNVRRSDRRLQIKQTRDLNEISKERIREDVEIFAPKVLLQIKDVLEKIGIRSTLSLETMRKHGRKMKGDFALNIYGKENLESFEDKISFNIDYKRNLLRGVIENYKFPSAPRNGRIEFALKHAKLVQEKYGYITKNLLSAHCKRSLKTATYFLVDLKKKGLVKVIEKPRDDMGHSLPQKYVLTE